MTVERQKAAASQFKGFRLPPPLIKRLEEAARLREIDLSQVVREILESSIKVYLDLSRTIHQQRMSEVIAAVRSDPDLAVLFEKSKDKKRLLVPIDTLLDQERLERLAAAIKAHQELRAAGAQPMMAPARIPDSVISEERLKQLELLDALIDRYSDQKAKDRFASLGDLVQRGELTLEQEPTGKIRFEFDEEVTWYVLKKRRNYSEGVRTAIDLISEGLLTPGGGGRAGGAAFLSSQVLTT